MFLDDRSWDEEEELNSLYVMQLSSGGDVNEELLIDSGAFGHCCPVGWHPEFPLKLPQTQGEIRTADGTLLTPLGSRTIPVQIRAKDRVIGVQITFEVLPVKRPLLSVSTLLQNVWSASFSSRQGLLTHNLSGLRVELEAKRMFYLPVCVGSLKDSPGSLVAPVGVEPEGEALAGAASEDQAPRAGEDPDLEDDEGQPVRLPSRPVGPSAADRALHSTTHLPFRSWCEECVAGQVSPDSPHKQQFEKSEMTTLMLDYFFLKSEGDASTATCLAAYVPQMQYGFAKVYEGKSASDTSSRPSCFPERSGASK